MLKNAWQEYTTRARELELRKLPETLNPKPHTLNLNPTQEYTAKARELELRKLLETRTRDREDKVCPMCA